jgi:serine/threonine-protein kinase
VSGGPLAPFDDARELGRGGAGVVYAARWGGREVALKVAHEGSDPREQERFLEEAQLLARVSHPAVIEVLESGTLVDGRPYLVMPLVQGETLAARLARGRLAPAPALRLFAQLVDAAAHLHDLGIVHRDIKPENVMILEAEERLVLLDFGIARDAESAPSTTTRMNLVRGTPACMAPERFFGTRASAATDVYELGVTLYAMLTGTLPWGDPMDAEARLHPRDPADLGITLPAGLSGLLLQALSTRQERRPSARELGARLGGIDVALGPTLKSAAPGAQPSLPYARTELAQPTPGAERARSLDPPPRSSRAARIVPVVITAGIGVAAIAAGLGLELRKRGHAAPEIARAGLVERARAITSALAVPSAAPAAAAPAPAPEASTEPVAVAPAASSAPAPRATTAPVHAEPRWCAKLVDLYCTPAARRMSGGDARCQARRADLARTEALPETTRARAEAGCRDSIPALEASIRAPQGSESPEDMPWCKRVAAAYCTPEVKATHGGDSLCAGGTRGFYGAYTARPPADRAAQNERCAQVLPGVIQAMKEHVRAFGPGGSASGAPSAPASRPSSAPAPASP